MQYGVPLKEYVDTDGQLGHIADYDTFLDELDCVWREVYRVLAPGGEMYFSDVYCDRRLPAEVGGLDAGDAGFSLAAGC